MSVTRVALDALTASLKDDLVHADKHVADIRTWEVSAPVGYRSMRQRCFCTTCTARLALFLAARMGRPMDFVVYDERLARAADAEGLRVLR